jgi:hypothetical protein
MKKFEKFLRSRKGMFSLFGGLVVLLLIAAYFTGSLDGIIGTAGIPTNPTYPMPTGGYTCLPTCAENDGKMFVLVGSNEKNLSFEPIKVWIMVPGDQPTFKLGIFDGDTSKSVDNTVKLFGNGVINYTNGNWDNALDGDTTYTLYADPLANGSGQTRLASWLGNDVMLNNAWWETSINRNELAKAPNGHYYYRLEASRPLDGRGTQAFKVRASGYIMTGLRPEWSVGVAGMMETVNDVKIIYPQSNGNMRNLGTGTYNGDWQMYFDVPSNQQKIDIWDGDFDRGTTVDTASLDTHDPNAPAKPAWATSSTADEGVGGVNGAGNPTDDSPIFYYKISPTVSYEVVAPSGQAIFTNDNPSGDNEWEKFSIDTNAADQPDVQVNAPLSAGMYVIHIKALDSHNYVWMGVNFPICDPNGGCPPPVWVEETCPKPIGYWKKAINTVYTKNRNYGFNESKVTLDWGLRNAALASKLYRSGINLTNPVAINNPPTPLTGIEANTIMQNKGKSLLTQALKQNLAAWMNLGIGKIGPYSQVEIKGITGGDFSGTMLEALSFNDDVILDPAKRADANLLKRVKEIASWINNNASDTTSTEDTESMACSQFAKGTFPEGEQPPKHANLPKAPTAPAPVVPPAPEPVCSAGNTYGVENATNDPFYSVKFNFVSGNDVKEGGSDTFKYTLPADVVAAMTNMQVEVKAAENSRNSTLICDFTNALGCGAPVSDELYSVSFDGAQDNGDGTFTLAFTVINTSPDALVHVAFSLPEGQTAGGMTESFTSEICVIPQP